MGVFAKEFGKFFGGMAKEMSQQILGRDKSKPAKVRYKDAQYYLQRQKEAGEYNRTMNKKHY